MVIAGPRRGPDRRPAADRAVPDPCQPAAPLRRRVTDDRHQAPNAAGSARSSAGSQCAVDEACGTPVGSGRNEKAIFTWFASRPIAQARAAVLCSLLTITGEDGDRSCSATVDQAILQGDARRSTSWPRDPRRRWQAPRRPGLLLRPRHHPARGSPARASEPSASTVPGGRSGVPAARGLAAPGLGRRAAAALRREADEIADGSVRSSLSSSSEPRLVRRPPPRSSLRSDRRVEAAVAPHYPKNPDGSYPWGYLWADHHPLRRMQAPIPARRFAGTPPPVPSHQRPRPGS